KDRRLHPLSHQILRQAYHQWGFPGAAYRDITDADGRLRQASHFEPTIPVGQVSPSHARRISPAAELSETPERLGEKIIPVTAQDLFPPGKDDLAPLFSHRHAQRVPTAEPNARFWASWNTRSGFTHVMHSCPKGQAFKLQPRHERPVA